MQTSELDGDCELIPGRWDPPGTITTAMIADYRNWLAWYDSACQFPEERKPDLIDRFIVQLGVGLAGKMSDADYNAKKASYRFMLMDHPAFCFDDAALRLTIRKFKTWWPTTGELDDFLGRYAVLNHEKARRARIVCDIGEREEDVRVNHRGFNSHAEMIERSRILNEEKRRKEREEMLAVIRNRNIADAEQKAAPETHPVEEAVE